MESYSYIKNARMDYEYLLKRFSRYAVTQNSWDIDFIYLTRYDDAQLLKLYDDYTLARYQKDNDEIKTFLKILGWSHEVLLYYEQKEYDGPENATSIIEFCKREKVTVNCRQHAIVLTEALLSMGYEARLVCCLPIDVLPYDNHAMTAVYSHTLAKWVALDSARNCYFVDEKGIMLSVADIRRHLIENNRICFKYMNRFMRIRSNNRIMQFDDNWYIDYLYKNFFRFYCSKVNGTTNTTPQYFYHLVPTGYANVDCEHNYSYKESTNRIIWNTDNQELFWRKPERKQEGKKYEL